MRHEELHAFLAVPERPGPGIPLAVKDIFDTAGLATTCGSAVFRERVPERTAEAVTRLEQAGYAVVGKANMHEFAYGISSENEHYGDVVNPLDATRIPGGSSGGSAVALAAGLADAALGTDSGGSIRIPAACCGIVGFKPSHGLVSTDGVFPLAPSFDHAGPMARSVDECAAMMRPLAGIEAAEAPLEELRVGVAWTALAEPLVRARVEEAAARFPGARPVAFPLPEGVTAVFMREVADVHRDLYAEHRALYGRGITVKIERCLAVTDEEYEDGLAARRRYEEACLEALGGFDLLLTPTLPFVAPPVGKEEDELRWSVIRLTFPFNALGWPVLAMPCGPAEGGMPASVSLTGRADDDALVLGAARALERALYPI
jgi:aspartyl-tRNA(Asn)/glutamyl-tRNA(Gln) amidotransferase subunit A